jgi:hypothetical protein
MLGGRSFGLTDATGNTYGFPRVVVYGANGKIKFPSGGGPGVIPTLQQVVNTGNGISNFGGAGTASIQSTNFTNNRTLLLNDNAFPTIRLVDNLNAANYLQIDIDTLNIDGVSYNWSSIVNPPSGALVALPFTTDHLAATNNPYLIGDIVYYLGNIYRCIAGNDSILPTNAAYWTSLGAGFPLVQQPSDWNSTSGNNQILNKPTISTYTVDNGLTENPAGNFQLGGLLLGDTSIDGDTNQFSIEFASMYNILGSAFFKTAFVVDDGTDKADLSMVPSSVTIGVETVAVSGFSSNITLTPTVAELKYIVSGTGNLGISADATTLKITTPDVRSATATVGQVLTLQNATTGEVEFQTPGTTTGDSLSPLLLMGG